MSDGMTSFEAFIEGVESLNTLNERVAKASVSGVLAAAKKTGAAGTTPEGTPWPASSEGGRALADAAGGISAKAEKNKIELQIGAPLVYHQHGAGGSSTTKEAERHRARTAAKQEKSGKASKFHAPERKIIPNPGDPIPKGAREAIANAARDVFTEAVK